MVPELGHGDALRRIAGDSTIIPRRGGCPALTKSIRDVSQRSMFSRSVGLPMFSSKDAEGTDPVGCRPKGCVWIFFEI